MSLARIAGFSALSLVVLLGLHFFAKPVLNYLCLEDGILETLTAISYLISAMLFFLLWMKSGFRNIWFMGYFVLFFFIAGEEVSWGQRLFNMGVPEALAQVNVQNELNLHNIDFIHGMVRALGLMVVIGICYFIPITNRLFRPFNSFYAKSGAPLFAIRLWVIPAIAIALMVVGRLFHDPGLHDLDEVGEAYLAVGFFGFALNIWTAERSQRI